MPLETWESVGLEKLGAPSLAIVAVPAQHGPKLVATLLPQVNGYMIETERADGTRLRIYVSGDTLVCDALREIPKRFPEIDVALLHLGGTRIPTARFGVLVTLDAAGGVELVQLLNPRYVVPIHTDDWSVFSSGLSDFVNALTKAAPRSRLRVVQRGETIQL